MQSLFQDMKIYLAESGGLWGAYFSSEQFSHAYVLQSYYYADEFTEKQIIPNAKEFILDSGAFTFMASAKSAVDWQKYAHEYAAFIKKNNVKKYIELDLDYVIGYPKTLKLREILERETGTKCIPVWHPCRGKSEFLKMCEQYDYVALGGIVGQKWRGMEQYFPWFIKQAHKRGAKIHGLGYTKLTKLHQYHFDSVDSTAWTAGNRFGFIYEFKNGQLIKHNVPKGKRISKDKAKDVALKNYEEWVKFQRWAETNL